MVSYIEQLLYLLTKMLCLGSYLPPLKYNSKKFDSTSLEILANGPSLMKHIDKLLANNEGDSQICVMNFMGNESFFPQLKPQIYCLADPIFFAPKDKFEMVKTLYQNLDNLVTWDMELYIPADFLKKRFLSFSKITNPHIHVKYVWPIHYSGSIKVSYWLYKKGIASVTTRTIANMAVQVGINKGYKNIKLYGVDMSFFDSVQLNERGELCSVYQHLNEKPVLRPFRNPEGKILKVSEYIIERGLMFKSHDELAGYAKYIGCNIINATPNTLLDSYQRL